MDVAAFSELVRSNVILGAGLTELTPTAVRVIEP
jgi:hypothetical protein